MTIRELKEKLRDIPENTKVQISIDFLVNGQQTDLARTVDFVIHDKKNDVVLLNSKVPIHFLY